jgi:uncharacterized phage-associated protein
MNPNATSLANYFIDLATSSEKDIFQLGLMKRVYITHGFCLALFDRSAIDPRFDVVEAWKYGPVIPSVYHSFKHNGKNPIKEKSKFIDVNLDTWDITETVPSLEDEQVVKVARMVWKRYDGYTDQQMVALTHRQGTPWGICYREGKTCEIPDEYTKAFYKKLVNQAR